MPVVFDNAASSNVSGTALQFTLTAAADANVLLAFYAANGNNSVSAVAYGGVALTKLGQVSQAAGPNLEVWGLTAPAAGANVLSAQFAGASGFWLASAITYKGAAFSSPFGTPNSGTATSATNPTLSVSSTTTDIVVTAFRSGFVATSFNNATPRTSASGSFQVMIAGDAPGAADVSISATSNASTNWAFLGIPVRSATPPVTFDNAAAVAGSGTATFSLTITAQSNAVLLLFTGTSLSNSLESAVANGLSLTRLGQGNLERCELWGLTAAPSGVFVISAKFATSSDWAIGAATYINAASADPFGGVVSGTATTTTNPHITASATLSDLLVAGFRSLVIQAFTTSSVSMTRTRLTAAAASGPVIALADSLVRSATAIVSGSTGSTTWFMLSVPIHSSQSTTAAVASSTLTPSLPLLGAGF